MAGFHCEAHYMTSDGAELERLRKQVKILQDANGVIATNTRHWISRFMAVERENRRLHRTLEKVIRFSSESSIGKNG